MTNQTSTSQGSAGSCGNSNDPVSARPDDRRTCPPTSTSKRRSPAAKRRSTAGGDGVSPQRSSLVIRTHDVITWAQCHKKDYYARVRGWRPKRVSNNTIIGSAVHSVIAYMQRFVDPQYTDPYLDHYPDLEDLLYDAAYLVIPEEMDDETAELLAENAVDIAWYWWINMGAREKAMEIAEYVALEDPKQIVLPHGTINCTPDVIFRRKNGTWVLRDYKTKENVNVLYDHFELDLQMIAYQVVAREMGCNPVEVQHVILRREVPPGFGNRPLYAEGVDKNGKPFKRLSRASQRVEDYIRTYSFIKDADVIDHYKQILDQYLVAMQNESLGHLRSPGPLCAQCPFFIPCTEEIVGRTMDDATASYLYDLTKG